MLVHIHLRLQEKYVFHCADFREIESLNWFCKNVV
jgi:hypothetical protein